MKNIIITGGAGFIGSHAVDLFMKDPEYRLTAVVDKLTYAADKTRVTKYFPHIRLYTFDIADLSWEYVFDKEQTDIVLNFSAESHVDNSIADGNIFEFIKSNYTGVARIISAVHNYKKKEILFVQLSTDEVLGDLPVDSLDELSESAPLKPNNPYSASKAAAEQLIQATDHTYNNLNYLILRATNNYGTNQHFEKFIPTVIQSLLTGKKIPLYGQGQNIREWLWVDDFVYGIRSSIDAFFTKGMNKQIIHFGSGVRKTNLEVVQTILKLVQKPQTEIELVTDRLGHDRKYALNSARAMSWLGWCAQQDFEAGLRIVIDDVTQRLDEQTCKGISTNEE